MVILFLKLQPTKTLLRLPYHLANANDEEDNNLLRRKSLQTNLVEEEIVANKS
jgi:hypothetical protein